jgi:hypothetical protein
MDSEQGDLMMTEEALLYLTLADERVVHREVNMSDDKGFVR